MFKKIKIKFKNRIKSLNNTVKHTISFRLLLTHIGVSLIPIIVMGVLFYLISFYIIQQKVCESTIDKLSKVSSMVDIKVENVARYMKLFRSHYEINKILQKEFSKYEYDDVSKVIDSFEELLNANPSIKSLLLTTNTGHLYRSGEYSWFDYNLEAKKSLQYLNETGESYYDMGIRERKNYMIEGRKIISFSLALTNYLNMDDLGVLFVDISPEEMFDFVYENQSGKGIVVLDKNGNIIINSDKSTDSKTLYESFDKTLISSESLGTYMREINGETSYIVFYKSEVTGWTYIEYNPVSVISSEMSIYGNIIIFVIISIIFIVFSVSNYISHKISKPIQTLTGLMMQVEKGNFDVSANIRQNDEIGRLGDGFNSMVKRLNTLIKRIYQQEQKKKEVEIEVLQSQINPHFLYNTLNSIKWMAILHGVDSISEMISSLIQLLKLSLGKYGTMIELQQELTMLQQYVNILNVRFNNGISFKYDIPEYLKKAKIPRLLLQPLVENSIIHGFEPDNIQGEITISCTKKEGDLTITVKDNGKGIRNVDLEELNNGKSYTRQSLNNIGIKNIDERIKLYYGKSYCLKIESIENEGTLAVITIPYYTGENDHDAHGRRNDD